jgi:hypothetical protein
MRFGMLSGLTLIRYSTMLWVYLGIRFFLCLGFITGIMYFGAKLKQKSLPASNQTTKSRFVSLGIGWSPRKEERRKGMVAERRQDRRTAWIATLTLILGVVIGYASRNYQISSTTSKLPNTLVLDQLQDGSYRMLLADGRKINTSFCPDKNGNVDKSLVRGNKLKEFNYVQLSGCKNIYGYGLGYVAYAENGVRLKFPIPEEIADAR